MKINSDLREDLAPGCQAVSVDLLRVWESSGKEEKEVTSAELLHLEGQRTGRAEGACFSPAEVQAACEKTTQCLQAGLTGLRSENH